MHDFAFISKIATAPEGMRFFGIWHEDMPAVVEKLRVKAKADYRARISIDKLDAAHREVFIRAINNVLATENAIFTYAQIIDGLPIGDVAFDRRNPGLFGDHPLDGEHEQLCPGALDKAREVCPKWDPAMLAFDPRVCFFQFRSFIFLRRHANSGLCRSSTHSKEQSPGPKCSTRASSRW